MKDELDEEATTFNGCEAPSGMRADGVESFQNFYSRLSLANSLRWRGKWRDEGRMTHEDNHAILDSIAGQLELTDYQQTRAHNLIDKLPDTVFQAYQSLLLGLCVCGVVGYQDGRNYHPNSVRTETDTSAADMYVELYEETDASYRAFYTCWKRVEQVAT